MFVIRIKSYVDRYYVENVLKKVNLLEESLFKCVDCMEKWTNFQRLLTIFISADRNKLHDDIWY